MGVRSYYDIYIYTMMVCHNNIYADITILIMVCHNYDISTIMADLEKDPMQSMNGTMIQSNLLYP